MRNDPHDGFAAAWSLPRHAADACKTDVPKRREVVVLNPPPGAETQPDATPMIATRGGRGGSGLDQRIFDG